MAEPEDVEELLPGIGANGRETGLPHLWRLWNEGQDNAHAMIVGMRGAPKTASSFLLLLHLAAPEEPAQVVFDEGRPQGRRMT